MGGGRDGSGRDGGAAVAEVAVEMAARWWLRWRQRRRRGDGSPSNVHWRAWKREIEVEREGQSDKIEDNWSGFDLETWTWLSRGRRCHVAVTATWT